MPNASRGPKRWRLAEAEKAIGDVLEAAERLYHLQEKPRVDRIGPGSDWELRSTSLSLWTLSGPAKMSVSITDTFAHLHFRFDEPARAVADGLGNNGQLNPHSGKWNLHDSPPTLLSEFAESVIGRLTGVADPNRSGRDAVALQTRETKRQEIMRRHAEIREIHDPVEKSQALMQLFQDGLRVYETALDLDPSDYVGFWELGLPRMSHEQIEGHIANLRVEIAALQEKLRIVNK